MFDLQNQQTS